MGVAGVGGGDALELAQRGLIGDTETAALSGADGTIDWWCPRRFDAPAALFRLLDPEGGAVRVGPADTGRATGTQTYDPGTNVLRTVLPAAGAAELEVADFMPWSGRGERASGRIVRVVTARRGTVDVEVEVVPGSRFGVPDRVSEWSHGVTFDGVVVRTGAPLVEPRRAATRLAAGERMVVTIDLADDDRHHEPLSADAALRELDTTAEAWRRFLAGSTYAGPYRAQVDRSLLVLRALTNRTTGAVVAAPTTSLPEESGGERNWDYRYAWVRDASLAAEAFRHTGLHEEGDAFTHWLALVLEGGQVPLRPVYGVDGDNVPEEEELPLAGRRRSQPVRVGNAAGGQRQLDLLADLVSVVHAEQLLGGHPILGRWDALAALADWTTDHWHEPDHGVWEIRNGPRQLVSSKLACWWTVHHMVGLARAMNPLDLAAVGWQQAERDVMAWLEASPLTATNWRADDGSSEGVLDASLLRMAWRGPWPADHEVVTRTVDRILGHLSAGALLYRYPPGTDGLPGTEAPFLPCSFWAVCALAAMGRWEEAHERMEAACAVGGQLGLLAEEAHPVSHALLGNYPQALTHLSLLQAALALEPGPR